MTPLNNHHDPLPEILERLSAIDTKLTWIVGNDGTGGLMNAHDTRLGKLETFKSRVLGGLALITGGAGVIGGIAGFLRLFR